LKLEINALVSEMGFDAHGGLEIGATVIFSDSLTQLSLEDVLAQEVASDEEWEEREPLGGYASGATMIPMDLSTSVLCSLQDFGCVQ
jgi:hypothetical protein